MVSAEHVASHLYIKKEVRAYSGMHKEATNALDVRTEQTACEVLGMCLEFCNGLIAGEVRRVFIDFPYIAFALCARHEQLDIRDGVTSAYLVVTGDKT